jgi:16S rRNA (uracil1498-N3)-methyltransferase
MQTTTICGLTNSGPMNIVLLRENDWTSGNTVRLADYRAYHLINVIKVEINQPLRVGLINGHRGSAIVRQVAENTVELEVTLAEAPLPRHPIHLVLALPRPKMLRRVFRSVAEFGVAELHLIHSYRVEKSYWQSPFLDEDKIEIALIQGLERAGDTVLPRVYQHKRFKPFVEDVLPGVSNDRALLIAHPGANQTLPTDTMTPTTLLVGPEGGFIDYEVDLAQQAGATAVSLGSRILSVDTAVCAVLARELT